MLKVVFSTAEPVFYYNNIVNFETFIIEVATINFNVSLKINEKYKN